MRRIKIIIAFIISLSFLILTTACNNNGLFGGSNTPLPTSIVSTQPLESGLPTQPTTSPQVQTVQTDKVSEYLPFAKDVYMKYKGTGNEFAAYDTYVQFAEADLMQIRKDNGGTVSVIVYQLIDGAIKKVFTQGETYYHYDYTSSRNDDEIILKEPIKVGTSWKLKDGSVRSITSVNKQIKTPAGDYNALEITTKRKDTTEHDYYAKSIGLVKSEFLDNNGSVSITSELEKVEKNVPFKGTVKIYFPQFSTDKVVSVEREVQINSNEDMKFKFQKEFKTIPSGSTLTKVLSDNVKILSIKVDDKAGIVTVDFSADLIKGMNAGTSLELMIIKSITNTFGNYFQKDKVIINLEGKSYESGHILMKKGEYFTVAE
ncbi:MAG TPA: GerMN domain-containing protein [Clostridia bacterium]|nr:GerMN domain-containing protein [Clostridia bacterium]